MSLYRIHWKVAQTGAEGHGAGSWPYDRATRFAKALNHEDEEGVTYWVEAEPEEPDGDS